MQILPFKTYSDLWIMVTKNITQTISFNYMKCIEAMRQLNMSKHLHFFFFFCKFCFSCSQNNANIWKQLMRKFAEKTITYIQLPLKSLEQIILFFFFPQTTEWKNFFLVSICAAIAEQISDPALCTYIGVKQKQTNKKMGLLCELVIL